MANNPAIRLPSGIAELVSDTSPQLGGDLDLNGHNIDFPTTANISDCLDENDMASNSATMLATQQSIKAYADLKVAKTLFDAHSILAATSDDTPAKLTVGEQTVVGRITSGNIVALTATQLSALTHSVGLAANWDIGSYDFRAKKITSDALGTAGQVVFTGVAGLLSADSAFMWDNTNKRMGIGIAPDVPLHVVGDVTFKETILTVERSAAAGVLYFDTYSESTGHKGHVFFRKSASDTLGTLTETANNDSQGTMSGWGVDTNSARVKSTAINFIQEGPAEDGYIPSRITFETSESAVGIAEVMRLTPTGNLGLATTTFDAAAKKCLVIANGTLPTSPTADQFYMWSADVAGLTGKAAPHFKGEEGGVIAFQPVLGVVDQLVYQNDTLADDGTVNLTDATSGIVFVSCNAEAGMWLVEVDGGCTKIAGSTNTADTESDTDLCVYDGGGTTAIVKNMLGVAGEVRIIYFNR